MVSQYKSIIYYHEDRPRWFETIKVMHHVILFTYLYTLYTCIVKKFLFHLSHGVYES